MTFWRCTTAFSTLL